MGDGRKEYAMDMKGVGKGGFMRREVRGRPSWS